MPAVQRWYSPYLGDAASDAESRAYQQWHTLIVAVNQLKAQYAASGDPRFVQSIESMMPYLQTAGQKYAQIAQANQKADTPGQVMQTLSDLSDWLVQNVAQPIGDTLQSVPGTVNRLGNALPWIAGAVGLFLLWQSGVLKGLVKR
jgi:hypothetical protein